MPKWPETICKHEWQPVSLVLTPQLRGRVYCVCMKCHQHTHIVTEFVDSGRI